MTINELNEAISTMNPIEVNGRIHVIRPFTRETSYYPDPNYLGTGQALVGVVKEGETFLDFRNNYYHQKFKSLID